MLILDTHSVVALLGGDLEPWERALVLREEPAISDIVLWEPAKLVELGRVRMDLSGTEFRGLLQNLKVFPSPWRLLE